MDEAHLDLAVARLLEDVVHLVREVVRHLCEPPRLLPCPRHDPPRREPLEHQPARVRLGDLEDVEVGIEVDADRPQRRDRLVEQHEARRQAQVERVDQREPLADDLDRVDLLQARAVVAVVELAELGDELLLHLLRVADAELGEALRDHLDVLVRGVDEEARQLRHVLVGELARQPEVDEADLLGAEHEDVGGVRIAVEEAVAEDHRHPRLGDQVGEPAALVEGVPLDVEVGDLEAVEQLEREHACARVAPVDLRDAHVWMAGEVPVERVRAPRLEPVVELLPDRARELVDHLVRVDEVERAHPLLRDPRGLVQKREVGLDLARRVRPLHLHRDAPAVRERRAVDLADRGGGDRGLVEVEEEPLDRLAELLADHALGVRVRKRANVVLEPAQLEHDVGRDDVRARREQLAELDERRPELVEHLAEVLPPRRAGAVPRHRRRVDPLRDQVGEAVPLEEVAEAVLDRDLRDLRETAEVAGGRRRHPLSVARRERFSACAAWPRTPRSPDPLAPHASAAEVAEEHEHEDDDHDQQDDAEDEPPFDATGNPRPRRVANGARAGRRATPAPRAPRA